jgi:hypothetical protein
MSEAAEAFNAALLQPGNHRKVRHKSTKVKNDF